MLVFFDKMMVILENAILINKFCISQLLLEKLKNPYLEGLHKFKN